MASQSIGAIVYKGRPLSELSRDELLVAATWAFGELSGRGASKFRRLRAEKELLVGECVTVNGEVVAAMVPLDAGESGWFCVLPL